VPSIFSQRQEEQNKRTKPKGNPTGLPFQYLYILNMHEDECWKRKEKREKKPIKEGNLAGFSCM